MWYASSLISKTELNKSPLSDTYGLYKHYPDHWLMSETNDGDITNKENQLDFQRKIGGRVDLYTSDVGFDNSEDYAAQETKHIPANIGQLLSAVLTLKQGGSMVTKQYTTFEPATVALMYLVGSFFDEFFICKPHTSREANSETYLVGRGFRGLDAGVNKRVDALFDRLTRPLLPVYALKSLPLVYISAVVKFNIDLVNRQVKKINDDLERIEKKQINEYLQSVTGEIEDWYRLVDLSPIEPERALIRLVSGV
jgi:hypothetical protein